MSGPKTRDEKIDRDLALLAAIRFAAARHRDQRRKDSESSPYINHPIEVAHLLADTGGVREVVVLIAAVLHDTIEDTEATAEELEATFGGEVRRLVEEVSDDKSLPKAERKRVQIERAPGLSEGAKRIKIADKISNILDITNSPPADWPLARRREYLDWAEKVVAGCRGCSREMEELFDAVVAEGRRKLSPAPPEPG